MGSKMPLLFLGHGSPMNAIEDNRYTNTWKSILSQIPRPKAILALSAHWYVSGTRLQGAKNPELIYDMYGFPKELYEVKYPVKGSKDLSTRVLDLVGEGVQIDDSWGIDHGTWSILVHMIPDYSIPVVQMSIDMNKTFKDHWELGKKLAPLREEGYLILSSGNIVHNLRLVNWESDELSKEGQVFDNYVEDIITRGSYEDILSIKDHPNYKYAVPSPDHFIPLIYTLSLADKEDYVKVFNKGGNLSSISMTGYSFG